MNPAYLLFEQVCREVDKAVVGMTDAKKVIFASVLASGNVLLEGVPGLGKTLLARSFATALGFYFKRVQFTPDLMPSDIIGTSVFNQANGRFEFVPGPVFTDFLLADEINRAPAKTQAALLEAMEERQVTADNATYDLSSNFVVFATQNPVEFDGTYTLPEAQLDRFMIRIILGYPSEEEEDAILSSPADSISSRIPSISAISDSSTLIKDARIFVQSVTIDSRIVQYARTLISLSRRSDHLLLGNSPRAGQMLLRLARAFAAIEGMDYVTPDHIRQLAPYVLPHRWVLKPEAEVQQTPVENILRSLFTIAKIPE